VNPGRARGTSSACPHIAPRKPSGAASVATRTRRRWPGPTSSASAAGSTAGERLRPEREHGERHERPIAQNRDLATPRGSAPRRRPGAPRASRRRARPGRWSRAPPPAAAPTPNPRPAARGERASAERAGQAARRAELPALRGWPGFGMLRMCCLRLSTGSRRSRLPPRCLCTVCM
jgi:hypothetical protein